MDNMAESLSSLTRDLRLAIVILFCGALSGINIAKLAPTITTLAAEFDLSLTEIGMLASIFTVIMVGAGSLIGGIVRGGGGVRAARPQGAVRRPSAVVAARGDSAEHAACACACAPDRPDHSPQSSPY